MDNSREVDPRALRYLAGITPLFVFGLLCFSARILSRVIPSYRLNASDYVNASAMIAILVAYSLFVASIHEGLGRHSRSLTHENLVNLLRLIFFLKLFGIAAATLTRLSIALQLLPFSISTTWKGFLWGIATLELASLAAVILYSCLQVQPISANWDGSGYKGRVLVTYIFLVTCVIGDFWCSIMPLFLIWDLSRSKLERCLLSILIAMGLCAAAAAIIILVLLTRLQHATDPLRGTLKIFSWCLVEEAILMVASCAPLLKALVERTLYRLGFPEFRNIPRELGDSPSNHIWHKSRWRIARIWHSRHGSVSQYVDNTAVLKDSRCDSNAAPSYNTNKSISELDPASIGPPYQHE